MHSEYQHPSIQLFMMGLKPSDCRGNEIDCHIDEVKSEETEQISEDNDGHDDVVNEVSEGSTLVNLQGKKISDWEARRYGAMAARLLRDVKIT